MITSGKPVYVTEFDLKRLRMLLQDARRADSRNSKHLQELQAELDRAIVVSPEDVPNTVVTMNSTVELIDLDNGKREAYTLVFPDDADLEQGKISVLAPIGTAMLGYEVGDVFEWDVPAGRRRLRVDRVLYQPEAAGDYQR
jgi:regulator of nucleoside diphosphate kinase